MRARLEHNMGNHNGRVARLETAAGVHAVHKYMCVVGTGWETPEELAKGYKVQPMMASAGGTGGDPFYLATWDEVEAFAARPDVRLAVVRYFDNPSRKAEK
jgi:hypothetical protein